LIVTVTSVEERTSNVKFSFKVDGLPSTTTAL